MSKKSSTFVPDLGIVPSATIKSLRVMTKVLIFKCEGANRGFVHVVKFMPEGGDVYYRVMRNRRNIGRYPVYSNLDTAIAFAVSVSRDDIVIKEKVSAL